MDKETLHQTPSQTVGPYFAYGLTPEQYLYDFKSAWTPVMCEDGDNTIKIIGQVFDGAGDLIPDAMIELWQYDPGKSLFGRCGTGTDPDNRFNFRTIKPVQVDGNAPFITVIVFMRGQLIHSYTRMYFEDEAELNVKDEVLNSVPEDRRKTLIAKKSGNGLYEFNIRMQGKEETIFFEF